MAFANLAIQKVLLTGFKPVISVPIELFRFAYVPVTPQLKFWKSQKIKMNSSLKQTNSLFLFFLWFYFPFYFLYFFCFVRLFSLNIWFFLILSPTYMKNSKIFESVENSEPVVNSIIYHIAKHCPKIESVSQLSKYQSQLTIDPATLVCSCCAVPGSRASSITSTPSRTVLLW